MEIFSFRTIQHSSEGLYKEKGSKFIGLAFPVQSEEEVKLRLSEVKKQYFDARHHCYAYLIGADKSRFRAYDDGEPNHSAGDPILGQIRSRNITNVLVIVVRYFGGVKLGVGGLISAYKAAADDALNHTIMIEEEVVIDLQITYPYNETPEVMKLVKDFELEIKDHQFNDRCFLRGRIKQSMKNSLLEKYSLLTALGRDIAIEWNLN